MKKLIIFFIVLILINVSHAQTLQQVSKSGITPNNPFYRLDIAMERLQVALTWSKKAEAQIRLKNLEERLAEMEVMTEKGDNVAINKIRELEQREIDELEKINDDVDSNTKKDIEANLQKHVNILAALRETAPEQAQKGLTNAITQGSKVIEKMRESGRITTTTIRSPGYPLPKPQPITCPDGSKVLNQGDCPSDGGTFSPSSVISPPITTPQPGPILSPMPTIAPPTTLPMPIIVPTTLKQKFTCKDSDGINYNVKGELQVISESGSPSIYTDSCKGNYGVIEWYCENNIVKMVVGNCPSGTICVDGFCKAP